VNGFVALVATMTLLAIACVTLPLLRRRSEGGAVGVSESNLAVLRDQLDELNTDLANGTISARQFEAASAELERRVLDETSKSTKAEVRPVGRLTVVVLAIAIPLATLSLYLVVGSPQGLRDEVVAAPQQVTPEDIEAMVAKLAARLEKNPDDSRGWMMLARSYYVMQRMPEAVAAYAKAVEMTKDNADLYADYADALAMSQGRNIQGKPLELVNQALKLDPAHPKALAMAGTEAFYRKDYPGAIAFWEKLLPLLPPESEMAKSIEGGIAEARDLGKNTPAQRSAAPLASSPTGGKSAPGASVSGRISVSQAVASKAGPQDTVFVVARAQNGPRIPLAVLRRRVADLPFEFTLDDSLAMSPELKLSGFSEVVVTARISKSGPATPQRGDLQGASAPVKVGVRGLQLVIDSILP
jgi:cytochrome c-type biogenesis protein CcmH